MDRAGVVARVRKSILHNPLKARVAAGRTRRRHAYRSRAKALYQAELIIADEDEVRGEANRSSFLASGTMSVDGTNWTGISMLGKGGQGHAGLWVRLDPTTHRVLAKMVIKERNLNEAEWNGSLTWWQRPSLRIPREGAIAILMSRQEQRQLKKIVQAWDSSQTPAKRVLKRIKWMLIAVGWLSDDTVKDFQEELVPITLGNAIVEAFAYSVSEERKTTRLYMEHMDSGDLGELGIAYADGKTGLRPGHKIPEAFLWFVFYHLMVACREMERIHSLDRTSRNYVVHQDIKPGNVFLNRIPVSLNHYSRFRAPKIGDFGSARVTSSSDPSNQLGWNDTKTRGFEAPEYKYWYQPGSNVKITAAANVWQCAMTIYSLMRQRNPTFWPLNDKDDPWEGDVEQYSPDLNHAIRNCLLLDPAMRWTASAIIERIEQNHGRCFGFMRRSRTADQHRDQWVLYDPEGGPQSYAARFQMP